MEERIKKSAISSKSGCKKEENHVFVELSDLSKVKKSEKKSETKKSEKKSENKKSEKKSENKKSEKKSETKKSEKKSETKKSEKKSETKKSEKKSETKKSEKKSETKKSEKKSETKKVMESHINTFNFKGDPNVGLYCLSTNSYIIVGEDVSSEKKKILESTLKVPVIHTKIYGTPFAGIFVRVTQKTC